MLRLYENSHYLSLPIVLHIHGMIQESNTYCMLFTKVYYSSPTYSALVIYLKEITKKKKISLQQYKSHQQKSEYALNVIEEENG